MNTNVTLYRILNPVEEPIIEILFKGSYMWKE